MAPIRTAIIGLASGDAPSWAVGAHLPYLLSPRGRDKYQIVALLNSTVDAARAAIKRHGLPDTTKAYGDPEELAADGDVELVVCCSRVDVHHKTVLPSARAGKALYVEWPLAHNVQAARELVDAAREGGGRNMVGLQGRLMPVFPKIADLLRQGRIGKVLSSEIRGSNGDATPDAIPDKYAYFKDMAVGGNLVTIMFGHLWDQVQHVLGDVTDTTSRAQISLPRIRVLDSKTGDMSKAITSDVPDLFYIAGTVRGSRVGADGALVSGWCQGRAPFPGEPELVWTITGEKGEIRLTASSAKIAVFGLDKLIEIQVHDFSSGDVQPVEWAWDEWVLALPGPARCVAMLYDQYADGGVPAPTFEEAVKRLEALATIFE